MSLFALCSLVPITVFCLVNCGKKKNKGESTTKTAKSGGTKQSMTKPPSSIKPMSNESQLVKKEPSAPVAPPPEPVAPPPPPKVEESKVAEMVPESDKKEEDEMKGGIKLPEPPKNMKCEDDAK